MHVVASGAVQRSLIKERPLMFKLMKQKTNIWLTMATPSRGKHKMVAPICGQLVH
jgi:hypothetical protein